MKHGKADMRNWLLTLALLGASLIATAQEKYVVIAHSSDTHSCIEPISASHKDTALADKAGAVRRDVMLRQLREAHQGRVITLDCGDFSQGSVFYNLFKGEVEVQLMNKMKYDAVLIGNHEFDYGMENLARLIEMADFPFVCTNYDFTGTPLEGLVKPYIIIERAGVRVGVLGVSPKLEGLVSRKSYGKTKYIKPAKAAQPVIDLLRHKEQCDIVICLSHLGDLQQEDADTDFIARTKGIDLVLGGHTHSEFKTHRLVKDKDGKEVVLNHVGKHGRWVGTHTIVME